MKTDEQKRIGRFVTGRLKGRGLRQEADGARSEGWSIPRGPTWQGEVRVRVQVSIDGSGIRIEGHLNGEVVEHGVS